MTGFLCGFTQFIQASDGVVPRLGHDGSLPNPFHFIINLLSHHPTVCNLGTGGVFKPPTKNTPEERFAGSLRRCRKCSEQLASNEMTE